MSSLHRLLGAFAAFAILLSPLDVAAKLQRWTLENMSFGFVFDSISGEALAGGTVTGFFLVDDFDNRVVSWNIFTSPGWAFCNNPAEGNVCYTEGVHWTKGNSHVFSITRHLQLLQGDQNTYPMLNVFVVPTADPNVMTLDFFNSNEILSDAPTTYRRITSGHARLSGSR
jgi:hypothetical protein